MKKNSVEIFAWTKNCNHFSLESKWDLNDIYMIIFFLHANNQVSKLLRCQSSSNIKVVRVDVLRMLDSFIQNTNKFLLYSYNIEQKKFQVKALCLCETKITETDVQQL